MTSIGDVGAALLKIRERNKIGVGKVTQCDISRALGVHQNTVARWERQDMLPDDQETVKSILNLSKRVNDWHLKIVPLLITRITPVLQDSDVVFKRVSYDKITNNAAEISIILNHDVRDLTLMVVGSDRGKVTVAKAEKGPFHDSITFAKKIKNGEKIKVFINFS